MSKNREFKRIFNSPFTFPILAKIYDGFKPSQIAQQLGTTPQRLYYHTDSLVEAGWIIKVKATDESEGLSWRLTAQGQFILKEKLRQSVNTCSKIHGIAPIRLHNVTFAFKIKSFTQSSRLRWKEIKNGVSKCNIVYQDHAIELTKSRREWASVMEIHLPEQYLFDPFKGVIAQYNKALPRRD
jgi:DNA-binding MarR family transcriptional regulator